MPVWPYIFWVFLYSIVLFLGSYFIQLRFFIDSYCEGSVETNAVALTFDDGPSPRFTPEILRILDKYQIPAAFFCIGKNIAGNESILKQMDASGHLIGNHSDTHHFWFDLWPADKMLDDIREMDHKTGLLLGKTNSFFRPPYGVTNPNLVKAIRKGNYLSIGWSIRSMDTVLKDKDKLRDRVCRQLKPGAIVLFHDHGWHTASVLESVILEIQSRGLRIVRVDELIGKPVLRKNVN